MDYAKLSHYIVRAALKAVKEKWAVAGGEANGELVKVCETGVE